LEYAKELAEHIAVNASNSEPRAITACWEGAKTRTGITAGEVARAIIPRKVVVGSGIPRACPAVSAIVRVSARGRRLHRAMPAPPCRCRVGADRSPQEL